MKKYLQLLSMMLCMMAGTMFFVACGDDDDDDTNPTSSITEQDLYGGWYGIDENSSEKVNLFWIYLEPEGRGMYGEVKAKAKHNWELEDASVDINWVLTSGVLTMSFESEEGTMYRVGEVLSKNSDGSLQVKRHLDEGETDVITIYPLQNMDNLYRMMEEMIASKK